MTRLMTKPAHKEDRVKYDPKKDACQKEKKNTTQTAEDCIDREDVAWRNSLRPLDPTLNYKTVQDKKKSRNK